MTGRWKIAGQLKTWPGALDDIVWGKKKADVRRIDDRAFKVGEVWELIPWDPEGKCIVPNVPSVLIRITHIQVTAGPLRLLGSPGYPVAVLSFEIV